MRGAILAISLVLAAALFAPGGANAQSPSETDRLRDALRSAITQSRALEDQRAALQAKVAEADRDKAALRAQIDAAKAEVKSVEKREREAVEEFNARLAERDDALDKWKSGYEEAVNVARSKDAERAKFETEANTYKASSKSCAAKNAQLVKIGQELLRDYRQLTIGDIAAAHEPLIGTRRVEILNLLQDSKDRVLDQKANP